MPEPRRDPSETLTWECANRAINKTKEMIRRNNLHDDPDVVQGLERWETAAEEWLRSGEQPQKINQSVHLLETAVEAVIAGEDIPWECVHLIRGPSEYYTMGCSIAHETLSEALGHSESLRGLGSSGGWWCPEPYHPGRHILLGNSPETGGR